MKIKKKEEKTELAKMQNNFFGYKDEKQHLMAGFSSDFAGT